MKNTIRIAAMIGLSLATARADDDALRADVLRGLQDVCIPAQMNGITAARYIDAVGALELGLTRIRLSNRSRSNVWQVSNVRDVYLNSMEDACSVTVEMNQYISDQLVSDLHADLSGLAAAPPATSGAPDQDAFFAGYCAALTGGGTTSFQLVSRERKLKPELGRRIGSTNRTLSVSASRQSQCGASQPD